MLGALLFPDLTGSFFTALVALLLLGAASVLLRALLLALPEALLRLELRALAEELLLEPYFP